jgi:hypothetical protein
MDRQIKDRWATFRTFHCYLLARRRAGSSETIKEKYHAAAG